MLVSAPAPQAADLLARSPEPGARVDAVRAATYRPALVGLLGLRLDAPPPWPAHTPEGGPPARVGVETAKGRPAAGGVTPVVAGLRDGLSAALLEATDEEVLRAVAPPLAALLGPSAARPEWAQVKRWRLA